MSTGEATPPNTAYLQHLRAEVDTSIAEASPQVSEFRGAPEADRERLGELVESRREDLLEIVHTLHGDPETAYEEVRSAALLAQMLQRHGHDVTTGAHGVETALRAEVATPRFDPAQHRTVAVLSEYDALPQIGHGCGHNVIAATGVGAFLALASLIESSDTGVQGRVVFLGTPAEEGHTGKEVMAAGGAFDGLDCAVMVHPFGYDTASHLFLGRRLLSVVFSGHSAHASAQPFQGRNALDAASLAYQAIGLLRQQMPPSDRVHAIVTDGGHRPSVIPDRAQLDLYVRSAYPDTLKDLSRRVGQIMEGAALMTDTGVELQWDAYPPSLPVRNNQTLAARWTQSQAERGRTALPAGVVPEVLAGSTDFGNVSVRMPAIHPMSAISDSDVALHTKEFAAAAATERADAAAIDGAIGLAVTAWDYLADDDLALAVRREFDEAGGPVDVERYFD
ncbi:MAG: M20 family metallopeptidase [Ornithinimicrobium sp.]